MYEKMNCISNCKNEGFRGELENSYGTVNQYDAKGPTDASPIRPKKQQNDTKDVCSENHAAYHR